MRRTGSEDPVQTVCTVLLFLAAAFVIYDFFFGTRPAPPRPAPQHAHSPPPDVGTKSDTTTRPNLACTGPDRLHHL